MASFCYQLVQPLHANMDNVVHIIHDASYSFGKEQRLLAVPQVRLNHISDLDVVSPAPSMGVTLKFALCISQDFTMSYHPPGPE